MTAADQHPAASPTPATTRDSYGKGRGAPHAGHTHPSVPNEKIQAPSE